MMASPNTWSPNAIPQGNYAAGLGVPGGLQRPTSSLAVGQNTRLLPSPSLMDAYHAAGPLDQFTLPPTPIQVPYLAPALAPVSLGAPACGGDEGAASRLEPEEEMVSKGVRPLSGVASSLLHVASTCVKLALRLPGACW